MFDFHQKRKLRTVLNSRITQGVLVFLSILVFWSAYDRYLIAKEMSDRRAGLEEEITSLKDRHEKLEGEVKYLSSERGIEAEMRREFDIAREGEKVVIILDDESATTVMPMATTSPAEARPWYKFW